MRKQISIACLAMILAPLPATASDWMVEGRVILIEGTYAPGHLPFQISVNAGSCRAGSFLNWHPKGADAAAQAVNYQAIISLLLTAQATGQNVRVFGNNDAECSVDYLYILKP